MSHRDSSPKTTSLKTCFHGDHQILGGGVLADWRSRSKGMVAEEQWKPTVRVSRHEHVGILSSLSSLFGRSSVVGHLGNQENIGRQTWKVPSRYHGSGPGCVSTPSWRICRSAQSLCKEPFLAKDTLVKGSEGRLHWPAEASRQWSQGKLQIRC